MSRRTEQTGFTLVEILVALVIGLFLTAGMVQMYVSNRQAYRFSEALSRMQENGRYALELMAKDMRMADFWGCSRGRDLTVHLDPSAGCATPTTAPDSTNAIAGTDGSPGAPDEPDSIVLRGAVGAGLIVDAASTTTILNVEGELADAQRVLAIGDIALVSDCRGGDLFQVTGLSESPTAVGIATGTGTPGNTTGILSHVYDQTANVHRWREVQYYIAVGANGGNALFLRENPCAGGVGREIAEGVENIQITYGEDVDGDATADRYGSAASVTEMDAVVSVRISMLLRSHENGLTDQPQRVIFNGQTFTAGDRRIHQVITATFALRNRTI